MIPNNTYWVYFGMVAVFYMSMSLILKEGKRSEEPSKPINLDNLDIMRYVGAICIVILHLRPFQHISYPLDLFFNNYITRIFVPFYFVVSGYFVAKKTKTEPDFLKRYSKSIIKLYLIWSVIYLPFGFEFIKAYNIPMYLYPIALIPALLYVGTYYHLWYFPALLVALWIVRWWQKRYSIKTLFIISMVLFSMGTMETYFGVLPQSFQIALESYYLPILFTTRNFLFFGLFFILLGYKLEGMDLGKIRKANLKCIVALIVLFAEVWLLQHVVRKDSNLMFMTAPAVFYVFVSTVQFAKSKNAIKYRNFATYLYLVHPMIIIAIAWKAQTLPESFLLLFVVIGISHAGAFVVSRFRKYLT